LFTSLIINILYDAIYNIQNIYKLTAVKKYYIYGGGKKMNTDRLFIKNLVGGIIVLLFAMSIIPSIEAGNIVTEKNTYAGKNALNTNEPGVWMEGTIGENGWYISCVTIGFFPDPAAEEIWYRFNDGNYQEYHEPFEYCIDGAYDFQWYWVDDRGVKHPQELIPFKMDTTPPVIELTRRFGLNNQVTFTATCIDDSSLVERVEFYLDDVLQETYTATPYKWTWTGTESHLVYAIGYNYAGLSEQSNTLSTPRSLSCYSLLSMKVFQIIYQIIFGNLQFI